MTTIKRFEDLEIWILSRNLANLVYDLSDSNPFSRDYALRDQIRRAAISVMSNIAEGFESQTQASFISYLGYAKASAGEVRAQLYLALDRSYISEDEFNTAIQISLTCSRKIASLIRYLQKQPNTPRFREDSFTYEL